MGVGVSMCRTMWWYDRGGGEAVGVWSGLCVDSSGVTGALRVFYARVRLECGCWRPVFNVAMCEAEVSAVVAVCSYVLIMADGDAWS